MSQSTSGAHHFFVDPDDVHDDLIEFSGAEGHHAARVLRLRPGERITVSDGSGRVLEATVTDVHRGVRAEINSVHTADRPKPVLTLYQALAKGERLDEVVSRAVEVGVARIVPFIAERSVVRWDDQRRRKARDRLTAIARAAAKQCRSPHLTSVSDVRDGLEDAATAGALMLVLHEGASVRLRDALPRTAPDTIAIVVGPEGGLAPSELDALRHEGADVVTLGERILRTSTAGPVAAAIIGYTYGNIG